MPDEALIKIAAISGGKAIEDAAVAWTMSLERAAGRVPTDRRYERSFAADIESPPRIIEIKASAKSYRGWFLPLEPVQVERGRIDPKFYVYVVENVGQGDPTKFTLKVLHGEQLKRRLDRALARTYYEVPWPVAEYDAAPTNLDPD